MLMMSKKPFGIRMRRRMCNVTGMTSTMSMMRMTMTMTKAQWSYEKSTRISFGKIVEPWVTDKKSKNTEGKKKRDEVDCQGEQRDEIDLGRQRAYISHLLWCTVRVMGD